MPAPRRAAPPPAPEIPEAERVEQLRLAVDAVEQLLPPAGPEPSPGWPARTDHLGTAVIEVRRLAATFEPEHWSTRWPRTPCGRCQGKGWYWDDPDITAHGWEPCRMCLTTGIELRTDRWNPVSSTVQLEPYER